MFKNLILNNIKNIILIFLFIFIGIITSLFKGYGDDIDSHAMIHTFIRIIQEGLYEPSRYYGYPFAELFYGFFAYFFGSFVSSFISYLFFLSSIVLIYKSYFKFTFIDYKLLLFVILCFSNPVLYLDNTNPSDAPLSLFLFSLGIYLFKKKNWTYAALFFALTISTRANYGLLVYAVILYEVFIQKKIDSKIIKVISICTIITALFYYPAFIINKFNLGFITNPGGPNLDLQSLAPRFIYKTFIAYGVFSSFAIIIFYFFNLKSVNKNIYKYRLEFLLILLNLLTYFFIPTKTSIISLSTILIYLIIFQITLKKKFIFFLIFLNLFSYVLSYQIFEFKYKYNNPCDPIEAIDAKFDLKFTKGYFFNRSEKMKMKINCDSKGFKDKSINYMMGKRLR